jgi:hypothetical protein
MIGIQPIKEVMMTDKTKLIIAGVGIGLTGLISYGVGFYRGGEYGIAESEKEFSKIVDDLCKENSRHIDEITKICDEKIADMQNRIEDNQQKFLDLWNSLTEEQKKKFIMRKQ